MLDSGYLERVRTSLATLMAEPDLTYAEKEELRYLIEELATIIAHLMAKLDYKATEDFRERIYIVDLAQGEVINEYE